MLISNCYWCYFLSQPISFSSSSQLALEEFEPLSFILFHWTELNQSILPPHYSQSHLSKWLIFCKDFPDSNLLPLKASPNCPTSLFPLSPTWLALQNMSYFRVLWAHHTAFKGTVLYLENVKLFFVWRTPRDYSSCSSSVSSFEWSVLSSLYTQLQWLQTMVSMQQPQHHMEMIRNADSWAPLQTHRTRNYSDRAQPAVR